LVLSHFSELSHLGDFVASHLTFGDKFEIICEGYYKIKNIYIFAWSSIPGVGHYRWLRSLISQLPPDSKVDYLIRII
jgi:hypothetical protein